MKRILFILLIFSLILCGCGREKYEILDYQKSNLEAECIVNEKYKIILKKEYDTCTITVCEPENLKGIYFEFLNGNASVSFESTKIQMDKKDLKGIYALSCMFSQKEECLTSATEKGSESLLTFEAEDCNYVITLGENSIPKEIDISGDGFSYHVEICSLKLL